MQVILPGDVARFAITDLESYLCCTSVIWVTNKLFFMVKVVFTLLFVENIKVIKVNTLRQSFLANLILRGFF